MNDQELLSSYFGDDAALENLQRIYHNYIAEFSPAGEDDYTNRFVGAVWDVVRKGRGDASARYDESRHGDLSTWLAEVARGVDGKAVKRRNGYKQPSGDSGRPVEPAKLLERFYGDGSLITEVKSRFDQLVQNTVLLLDVEESSSLTALMCRYDETLSNVVGPQRVGSVWSSVAAGLRDEGLRFSAEVHKSALIWLKGVSANVSPTDPRYAPYYECRTAKSEMPDSTQIRDSQLLRMFYGSCWCLPFPVEQISECVWSKSRARRRFEPDATAKMWVDCHVGDIYYSEVIKFYYTTDDDSPDREHACERIYLRFRKPVNERITWLLRLCSPTLKATYLTTGKLEETAADLTQQTFLKFVRSKSRTPFDPALSIPVSWFYILAQTTVQDWIRKKIGRETPPTKDVPENTIEMISDKRQEFGDDLINRLAFQKCVCSLDTRQQVAILTRVNPGISYQKIGELLGITADEAKTRVESHSGITPEGDLTVLPGRILENNELAALFGCAASTASELNKAAARNVAACMQRRGHD